MTHYWWMHWFWITCRLTLYIVLTHSTPLTPLSTVASQSQLEAEQNRSHRPLNLVHETAIPKPQLAITVPFSSTETSRPDTKSDPASCRNQTNTTIPVQLCSQTLYSDNLQVESTATATATTTTTVDENATTIVTADVTNNTTVIVTQTQSKELIGRKNEGEGESSSASGSDSAWNAASITGVSLGVLLSAVVLAAASAALYRRRYLNKPQTLNDKCSNPDSSGYIDDSTMRENSEEMYSLDNDSFLNSLEAMTIQNYWTDSVKHTKL